MLGWVGIDQLMKMSENSRGIDKKLYVNNNPTLSPHGDASCYETMTKLVQKFALNIPFLDGQGKL